MKTLYLDTNVMLAKWAPLDPFHKESVKIINAIENAKIGGIFSGLGLAEVVSVVERQKQKFSIQDSVKVNLTFEFIKRISMTTNLEIYDIVSSLNVLIANQKIAISAIHWLCIDVAQHLGLKTLDNLHIAIIILIEQTKGKKIDYFVSSDKEILSKANLIKKTYDFSVISPDKLVILEGL